MENGTRAVGRENGSRADTGADPSARREGRGADRILTRESKITNVHLRQVVRHAEQPEVDGLRDEVRHAEDERAGAAPQVVEPAVVESARQDVHAPCIKYTG